MAAKGRGRKKVLTKLPKGSILTDVTKTQWEILDPIGEGGFGVIYGTRKVNDTKKNEFAVKVEPSGNGPLFVERNYFLRYLKPEMLDKFKRDNKLSFLGLPKYITGGTHDSNDGSNRFLVMERFGANINSKLKASAKIDLDLLGKFCAQIIDSLMYIHETGYVHMDIKPDNLLLKYNSKGDQVYLIDFGIVDKCTTDSELKPDKKKQHNGTLLYCSRDSHLGVGTRRGDLEVLGYNILRWFDVELPWTNDKTPAAVQEKKIKFMQELPPNVLDKVPAHIVEFLKYVNKLEHDEVPDYSHVKSLLSEKIGSTKKGASSKTKPANVEEVLSPSPPKKGRPSIAVKKRGTKSSKTKRANVEEVLSPSPPKKGRPSIAEKKRGTKLSKTKPAENGFENQNNYAGRLRKRV